MLRNVLKMESERNSRLVTEVARPLHAIKTLFGGKRQLNLGVLLFRGRNFQDMVR